MYLPVLYKAVASSLPLHSHSHRGIEQSIHTVFLLPQSINRTNGCCQLMLYSNMQNSKWTEGSLTISRSSHLPSSWYGPVSSWPGPERDWKGGPLMVWGLRWQVKCHGNNSNCFTMVCLCHVKQYKEIFKISITTIRGCTHMTCMRILLIYGH